MMTVFHNPYTVNNIDGGITHPLNLLSFIDNETS